MQGRPTGEKDRTLFVWGLWPGSLKVNWKCGKS